MRIMLQHSDFPWLSNYLHFRPRLPVDKDFYLATFFCLALLSRNISEYIDTHHIEGDVYSEYLCRWVLKTILRIADFTQLQSTGKSQYLAQIKSAQHRLQKLLWKGCKAS